MMANVDNLTRCHPFSDALFTGRKYCCNDMFLIPALTHSFKCQTCLLRNDLPQGVAPIFPTDKCADDHFANNHIINCVICTTAVFHGTWTKEKATLHVTECIVKSTYNTSKPYVCTRCLKTIWFK